MPGTRVDVHEAAVRGLLNDPTGPVGRELTRAAQVVTRGAKRRCPVDTGRLRSSIGWDLDAVGGLHADVGTDVEYALFPEFGTKPHLIRSHGPWPLRDGGTVFGPVVHHPGTPATPYLRPALDDIRGG